MKVVIFAGAENKCRNTFGVNRVTREYLTVEREGIRVPLIISVSIEKCVNRLLLSYSSSMFAL